MFVGRVTGNVVATQKVASMTGHKLLNGRAVPRRREVPQQARADGPVVRRGRHRWGAGLGEMVLVCQGSSARLTPETEKLPIDAVVIGLIGTVDVEGRVIYSDRDRG